MGKPSQLADRIEAVEHQHGHRSELVLCVACEALTGIGWRLEGSEPPRRSPRACSPAPTCSVLGSCCGRSLSLCGLESARSTSSCCSLRSGPPFLANGSRARSRSFCSLWGIRWKASPCVGRAARSRCFRSSFPRRRLASTLRRRTRSRGGRAASRRSDLGQAEHQHRRGRLRRRRHGQHRSGADHRRECRRVSGWGS